MKKIIFGFVIFGFLTGNCSFGQVVDKQPTVNPTQPDEVASQAMSPDQAKPISYNLGKFVVASADEELSYIKVEVVVMFDWVNDEPLKKIDGRLKESITALLKKLTTKKAREDYIERILHQDIQKVIEAELEQSSPDTLKIKSVAIPDFLFN